jgi:hypothetical protein
MIKMIKLSSARSKVVRNALSTPIGLQFPASIPKPVQKIYRDSLDPEMGRHVSGVEFYYAVDGRTTFWWFGRCHGSGRLVGVVKRVWTFVGWRPQLNDTAMRPTRRGTVRGSNGYDDWELNPSRPSILLQKSLKHPKLVGTPLAYTGGFRPPPKLEDFVFNRPPPLAKHAAKRP